MAKKKIYVKDLVSKIEKMTKSRMSSGPVVSLDNLRDLARRKAEPAVILVIEDDETMRGALQRILESDGHVAKVAADAMELSSALEEVIPDLILLDIGLPWLNGLELGEMLKEHVELKKIPLVFISGKASAEEMKQAFKIGADDFIKKPFDIDQLRNTVAALLKISPKV